MRHPADGVEGADEAVAGQAEGVFRRQPEDAHDGEKHARDPRHDAVAQQCAGQAFHVSRLSAVGRAASSRGERRSQSHHMSHTKTPKTNHWSVYAAFWIGKGTLAV